MLQNIKKGERLSAGHPILSTPMPAILDEAFCRFATRACITWGAQRYTYADVDTASARIANRLRQAGLREGEHAAVYSRNSVAAFFAMLGIIRSGAVWIPINPLNAVNRNTELLLRFQVKALLYEERFAAAADAVKSGVTDCKALVCMDAQGIDGSPELKQWSAGAPATAPDVDLRPDDLVSIPMTGGTTGEPRGVMLTQRNFASITYAMCESFVGREEQFVMQCAAPMSHVSGRFALTSMAAGGRYVILDGVDLPKVLHSIEQDHITDLFLPPTAIYGLLAQPRLADHDFSSLRQFIYGSAPMAVGKLREAIKVFGPVMRGGYGQSECPMFISALWQEDLFIDGEVADDERLASVGRATVVSELAILDEQGSVLKQKQTGEIGVKSPNIFAGYWQQPGSREKLQLNGWHMTGDVGYFDADGFLHIVDRKKDMIISGGFNIYSVEVEQVLAQIQGVYIAVVIGVPSDKWGEAVKALIQIEPGARLGADAIIDYCKSQLGPVKAPKSVEFVDEFPRTPVGKIDKRAIRAPYWVASGRVV